MGRKSMAEERREEILAAFERCIIRHGIDVPLEQIADEAGVRRSLIRHYLGNRDDVVDQLIERIVAEYPRRVAAMLAEAIERGSAGVLDAMFPEDREAAWADAPPPDWDAVITAVVTTGQGRYPQAKRRVAQMMETIVAEAAAGLARLYPDAPDHAREEAIYGLFCLVQAHESMLLLGLDPRHTASARVCAGRLLAALGPAARYSETTSGT